MFSRTRPATSRAVELAQDDTLWDGSNESNPSTVDRSWIGRQVGEHRIVKHLGSGGMGHVFLGEHATRSERAAIKLLSAARASAAVARFPDEARLLSEQSHPNIVRLLDHGELDDSTPYVTMEHVPGIDLERWLNEHDSRSPARVLRILRQVAAAVDHLHARGILHRDIKPANIMLDVAAGDAVKLIDFGIAVRENACITSTPRVIGTPAYMAPEQARGARASRASDVYAVGALALELLTGSPPYAHASLQRMIKALLFEHPARPSSRGMFMPGLDACFARALARDPRRRFQSARELVDALEDVLCRSSESAVPAHGWGSIKALASVWIRRAVNGSCAEHAKVA